MTRYIVWVAATLGMLACSSDDNGPVVAATPIAWTVQTDTVGDALMISPVTPLRGASVYAVVVTSGIRSADGTNFGPSTDFAAFIGRQSPLPGGPTASYSNDLDSPANPYPDARLSRSDGSVRLPDRFVLRGMPTGPDAEEARRVLRNSANQVETIRGFSTTAPVRIAFSAPPDITTVRPDTVLFFRREDGATDIDGLLRASEALGVRREDIATGFSFPTQPIEDDLLAVQALLRDRALTITDPVQLFDNDLTDNRPRGVFGPEDPEFASFFEESPDVGTVVAGLIESPDFRNADGVWVDSLIAGETRAPLSQLDFLLILPASGEPPFPVVMVQHGFGGDNGTVLELAQLLAEQGLAAIGINAVEHGNRGNPLSLLRARPIVARDLFRQTIADQMAVLRAIEVGIDIDDDGQIELDPTRMSYIGISLGGMLGASLVAVEEILPTAVLNVAGGRVAFLGEAPDLRNLVQGELAAEVGLDREDPIFRVYIQRILELGQHGIDAADGSNFARHWFLEPFPGHQPHSVLLQQGIGDGLVTAESTATLANAGGLETNTPVSDPSGVSGLWQFDPPGGHGIIGRDDVQRQAAHFLATGGTEIIDPAN